MKQSKNPIKSMIQYSFPVDILILQRYWSDITPDIGMTLLIYSK